LNDDGFACIEILIGLILFLAILSIAIDAGRIRKLLIEHRGRMDRLETLLTWLPKRIAAALRDGGRSRAEGGAPPVDLTDGDAAEPDFSAFDDVAADAEGGARKRRPGR